MADIEHGGISILGRADLRRYGQIAAEAADAIAISRRWIAWRAHRGERDYLVAASIKNPANPGPLRRIATARGPAQIGRPSLSGGTLVYAVAKQRRNRLERVRLGAKGGIERRTIRTSRTEGLSNPVIQGSRWPTSRRQRNASASASAGLPRATAEPSSAGEPAKAHSGRWALAPSAST